MELDVQAAPSTAPGPINHGDALGADSGPGTVREHEARLVWASGSQHVRIGGLRFNVRKGRSLTCYYLTFNIR